MHHRPKPLRRSAGAVLLDRCQSQAQAHHHEDEECGAAVAHRERCAGEREQHEIQGIGKPLQHLPCEWLAALVRDPVLAAFRPAPLRLHRGQAALRGLELAEHNRHIENRQLREEGRHLLPVRAHTAVA